MSRNITKLTKKTEETASNLKKFTQSVVSNMSYGRFVCPNLKSTGTKPSIQCTQKEFSGIKLALKKDVRFNAIYHELHEQAVAAAKQAGQPKTKFAEYFDFDQLNDETIANMFCSASDIQDAEVAEMLVQHVVYVPSLGLSGTLIDICKYVQAYVIVDHPHAKFIARCLMIILLNEAASNGPNVLSCNDLKFNAEKKDYVLDRSVSVNQALWDNANVEDGKLSQTGIARAADLEKRYKKFMTDCGAAQNVANWYEINVPAAAHRDLFAHCEQMEVSDFPKKSEHKFAVEPESIRRITHANFIHLCRQTKAFATISLSKVPKELVVEHEEGSKDKVVMYRFCDMSNDDDVQRALLSFPLKIDGLASASDAKVSSKKAPAASRTPLQVVLEKYFEIAGLINVKAGAEETGHFDELVLGERSTDVTESFLTSGTKGFTCSKLSKADLEKNVKFVPCFDVSALPEVSGPNMETIFTMYQAGESDENYDDLVNGLILRTVKISQTRKSANGTPGQDAKVRARKFFELLFPDDEARVEYLTSLMIAKKSGSGQVDI